jgi:uncharacterized protein (TIGR02266 family)
MANDSRKDSRVKIVSLSVRYKSATLDEFVDNHAHDISSGGMFVKTQKAFAPGTLLKFEVRIAGDVAVISGVGRVAWKRDAEATTGDEPSGMGVKFIKLDDASKVVVERLTSAKSAGVSSAKVAVPSVVPVPLDDGGDHALGKEEIVVRQTRELLEQALQEAGGSLEEIMNLPGVIASSADPPMPAAPEVAKPVEPAPVPPKVAVSAAPPSTMRRPRGDAAKPSDGDAKMPWFLPTFAVAGTLVVAMFAFRDELFGPASPPAAPTAAAPPSPPAAPTAAAPPSPPAAPTPAPTAAPPPPAVSPAVPPAPNSAVPSAVASAPPSAHPHASPPPAVPPKPTPQPQPQPKAPPKPTPPPKRPPVATPPADPGDNPY